MPEYIRVPFASLASFHAHWMPIGVRNAIACYLYWRFSQSDTILQHPIFLN